jgi:plasmid stabilization system protein ParE
MAKSRVNWTRKAHSELYETLDYYANRNKSRIYSSKLHNEIKQKLKSLDFSVALPQKTSKSNIFYFTHKHISIFFSIHNNALFVKSVWDERRDPNGLKRILEHID